VFWSLYQSGILFFSSIFFPPRIFFSHGRRLNTFRSFRFTNEVQVLYSLQALFLTGPPDSDFAVQEVVIPQVVSSPPVVLDVSRAQIIILSLTYPVFFFVCLESFFNFCPPLPTSPRRFFAQFFVEKDHPTHPEIGFSFFQLLNRLTYMGILFLVRSRMSGSVFPS